MEADIKTQRAIDAAFDGQRVRTHFFVPGHAKPSGSKNAVPIFRNGEALMRTNDRGQRVPVVAVLDQSKNKDWKASVRQYAGTVFKEPPIAVPCMLVLTFMVQRPKNHYGTGKNSEALKATSPVRPAKKPDLLKLARCVEDALTGIIYADDCLIVDEHLHKRYISAKDFENQFGREGVFVTVATV
jgi:Holliday junction resolvase RusA-like endonuclease